MSTQTGQSRSTRSEAFHSCLSQAAALRSLQLNTETTTSRVIVTQIITGRTRRGTWGGQQRSSRSTVLKPAAVEAFNPTATLFSLNSCKNSSSVQSRIIRLDFFFALLHLFIYNFHWEWLQHIFLTFQNPLNVQPFLQFQFDFLTEISPHSIFWLSSCQNPDERCSELIKMLFLSPTSTKIITVSSQQWSFRGNSESFEGFGPPFLSLVEIVGA